MEKPVSSAYGSDDSGKSMKSQPLCMRLSLKKGVPYIFPSILSV
jgi:hypothetical protein